MKTEVFPIDDAPEFKEGDIVCLIDDPKSVMLVTCVAKDYNDSQEGTFWAINLTGKRISGGNYLKSLFKRFHGKIVIEE